MARRRRIPGLWAVLLVLVVATIVPSIPLHGVRPATDSALVTDSGGPGCGNSSNPCAVIFTESGLPGTPNWNVTINGTLEHSTPSTQITVYLLDGSHPFQVGAYAGYTPSPASGTAVVNGNDTNITIGWSLPQYTVTFQESGLPSSTQWTVDLNGNPQSSTSSTIGIPESNGTYTFSIQSSNSQYSPSPASGSVTVNGGSPPNVAISFSLFTYSVTFSESGLPLGSGTTWTVTLGGVASLPSSSSSITFSEPNQTYAYTVQTSNSEYTPSPASGSVKVKGGNVLVPIRFLPNLYPVYFNETGLPSGFSWSVSLNGGAPVSTTSSSLVLNVFNGTYTFRVTSANTSYQPTPASGSFVVSGSLVRVTIVFSAVTYTITFTETGFPISAQPWSVTLAGATKQSQTTTIVFPEPNGTYAWNVTPVSGWHASLYSGNALVNGAGVSISLLWVLVTYNVWVNETGLPAGYNWAVTFNGVYRTANTSSIPFTPQPNGTYPFTVQKLAGYRANVYSGQVVVAGGPVNQTIGWTQVVYALSFLESGLPSGALWNVSIGSQTVGSTLPILSFSLPNGTYNYSIAGPSGFVPTPQSGHLSIYGSSRNVSIGFGPFVYTVSFNETGLAPGKTWAVALDGVRFASNTSTISAHEANGSYTYFVQKVTGYVFSPNGGTFQVSGQPLVLNITYTAVTYLVAFSATGLLANQNWSVTVGPTTEVALGNQAITFALANGTYAFRVNALPLEIPLAGIASSCGQNVTLPAGNLTVCGRTVLLTEGFLAVPGWPVTFLEQGLDVGVAWSVSIDGAVYFGSAPSLIVNITNGVYSFYLGFVPGYEAPVSSGIVRVANGSVAINVTFVKLAGAHIGPPHGFSTSDWLLIGGAVAAGMIVGSALLIRRRRERSSSEDAAGTAARRSPP